jgi:hypothetical protein
LPVEGAGVLFEIVLGRVRLFRGPVPFVGTTAAAAIAVAVAAVSVVVVFATTGTGEGAETLFQALGKIVEICFGNPLRGLVSAFASGSTLAACAAVSALGAACAAFAFSGAVSVAAFG